MKKINLVIGLDIGKSHLDFYYKIGNKIYTGQINNTIKAIKKWLKKFDASSTLIVLEPTGTYSDKATSLLSKSGFTIKLVHPKQSHHFSQLLGITDKTDERAAQMLCYMGNTIELAVYQPVSDIMKERKQLLMTINALSKQKQALENQIHSLEQYLEPSDFCLDRLKKVHETTEQSIQRLEEKLLDLKDEQFDDIYKLATSITGIGPVTANWLILLTNGLQNFNNAKQVVNFIGLCSTSHTSGSSVRKKGGITKAGHGKARGALFMAAKSAIRYNKACKALYERLRTKGKGYFKAMVAVMGKLVRQFFGVVKSKVKFDNNYAPNFAKINM